MLIAIIGEHCSGKSTLAEKLKGALGAEVLVNGDPAELAEAIKARE